MVGVAALRLFFNCDVSFYVSLACFLLVVHFVSLRHLVSVSVCKRPVALGRTCVVFSSAQVAPRTPVQCFWV